MIHTDSDNTDLISTDQQVIQSAAGDDDFVGSEGNDDFCVRSLGA